MSPLAILIAATLLVASLAALAIVPSAGMRFEAAGFLQFLALAACMIGLAGWCRFRKLDPRVGDAATIVAIGTVALMACGVISNAGLRLGAAPIDVWLASADAAVGIDVERAVRAMVAHAWAIDALTWIYNASGAAIVVLIAARTVAGHRAKAWELLATVVVSMQAVALLSIAFPAIGAMAHLDMLDLQGNGLPSGAGVYHLEAFRQFHQGSDPVLRLSEMSGLVTFPSFHTVLALLAVQALADTRLRWLAVAWTAAVIVSTIPIGGHYVTDLVAGFAIWAGCAWTARRFSNPSA
ncbi:phosphatase PAP2 family protein [Tsuneonella dongtanensis]|uniref:phosphatase PAP2 family protein n=1 Tax=Tsuneonella dongtanensis TaxID=692370 RepID=UPI00082C389E|nr:phosphatase PAP2 family protein [Tsuneonella dongtanensis]